MKFHWVNVHGITSNEEAVHSLRFFRFNLLDTLACLIVSVVNLRESINVFLIYSALFCIYFHHSFKFNFISRSEFYSNSNNIFLQGFFKTAKEKTLFLSDPIENYAAYTIIEKWSLKSEIFYARFYEFGDIKTADFT